MGIVLHDHANVRYLVGSVRGALTGSVASLDQKALALESDELQLLKEQQNIIEELRKRYAPAV